MHNMRASRAAVAAACLNDPLIQGVPPIQVQKQTPNPLSNSINLHPLMKLDSQDAPNYDSSINLTNI